MWVVSIHWTKGTPCYIYQFWPPCTHASISCLPNSSPHALWIYFFPSPFHLTAILGPCLRHWTKPLGFFVIEHFSFPMLFGFIFSLFGCLDPPVRRVCWRWTYAMVLISELNLHWHRNDAPWLFCWSMDQFTGSGPKIHRSSTWCKSVSQLCLYRLMFSHSQVRLWTWAYAWQPTLPD